MKALYQLLAKETYVITVSKYETFFHLKVYSENGVTIFNETDLNLETLLSQALRKCNEIERREKKKIRK